jgi:hypothetical protein
LRSSGRKWIINESRYLKGMWEVASPQRKCCDSNVPLYKQLQILQSWNLVRWYLWDSYNYGQFIIILLFWTNFL